MVYRLRLTLKDSELILDYREQGTDEWGFAVRCSFSDPAQAHKEFGALRALRLPAHGVIAAFRDWNCIIPVALQGADSVLLMKEQDFIER